MSSSSSSSAQKIVAKILKNGIKNFRSRKGNRKGYNDGSNPRKSNSIAGETRTFTQTCPMRLASITKSTGATTYNNPTASVCYFGSGATNITADPCFSAYFTLNDLNQATTYTALFDQYRIDKVRVTFTPVSYPNTALFSASNILNQPDCSLWYTVDHDDSTVVSPLLALTEHEACQCVPFTGKPIHITFTPHIAAAVYASGVFTSFADAKNPWVDCGSPDVQHYGIKWGMACPISTSFGLPAFSATVQMTVSFKGAR